jgi:hypothetical protein
MNNMIESKNKIYFRIVFALLFAWYFMNCALHQQSWHFIDNVDLIIHEAGHWIFIFFGEMISVIGGSFNQILIPFIFSVYFFLRRDFYSAYLVFMWFGYNIVNVSVYMADALYMNLPLLGGDSVIHDWNYILGKFNLLNQAHLLGSITRTIGIFVIITGAVLALRFGLKNNEK